VPWVLLDVALAVASVLLLAVLLWQAWHQLKSLTRALGAASSAAAGAREPLQPRTARPRH
jgi:hypothetical protein